MTKAPELFDGNPRSNPNHRERGPKRFSYTYEDIARVSGVAIGSVKNAASGPDRTLDPTDLESVVGYINRRRMPRKGKTT